MLVTSSLGFASVPWCLKEPSKGVSKKICSRLPYGGPFAVRRIRMLWRMSADNGAVLQ